MVPLSAETVPLPDAAGRVLATAIVGDRDQPPFNRSAMDGYAVRSVDVAQAPVQLRVVGEVAAGQMSHHVLGPGEAIRIMTGAPVPEGADCVQMVEKTRCDADVVTIESAVDAGRHIAARGQDLKAGEVALPVGTVLNSARMGVAWSIGAAEVSVVRRPRVAVLTTGDELVALQQTPGPTQIRDSNRCTISRIALRAGAEVVMSRIVRDDIDATRLAIREALAVCDVLALSGGVSAGDYDYVAECLVAEGVEEVFHKVHMKPGKPLWFGRRGAQRVFGLPGNPVSSFVTARHFMAPLLRRMGGRTQLHDASLELPLLEDTRGTGPRPTFKPVVIQWGTEAGVLVIGMHGSGDLRHFSQGAALVLFPANRSGFAAGERVTVLLDDEALGA